MDYNDFKPKFYVGPPAKFLRGRRCFFPKSGVIAAIYNATEDQCVSECRRHSWCSHFNFRQEYCDMFQGSISVKQAYRSPDDDNTACGIDCHTVPETDACQGAGVYNWVIQDYPNAYAPRNKRSNFNFNNHNSSHHVTVFESAVSIYGDGTLHSLLNGKSKGLIPVFNNHDHPKSTPALDLSPPPHFPQNQNQILASEHDRTPELTFTQNIYNEKNSEKEMVTLFPKIEMSTMRALTFDPAPPSKNEKSNTQLAITYETSSTSKPLLAITNEVTTKHPLTQPPRKNPGGGRPGGKRDEITFISDETKLIDHKENQYGHDN